MQLIQNLYKEGYIFTLNPDIDLTPMNVIQLQEQQSPVVLGPITDFIEGAPSPSIQIRTEPKPPMIDGSGSDAEASLEVGTSDLITKALNFIFKLNTTVSYQGFDSMEIKFNNVSSDSAYITAVHKYINGAKITSIQGIRNLCPKSKNCFIIYDILKADDIMISFKKKGKAAEKTDIKVLLNSTGVSSSGTFSENQDGTVIYKGKEPLAFAFKGLPFHINKGSFFNPGLGISIDRSIDFMKKSGSRGSSDQNNSGISSSKGITSVEYTVQVDEKFQVDPELFL